MIEIDIPGRGRFLIENIVFDYNGTLATDGIMKPETKNMILKIKEMLNVYILTADTYGTVRKESEELGVIVKTFPNSEAGKYKKKIIEEIGSRNTVCVGNGFNDIQMFQESLLSIAVIGEEGCSGRLMASADIIVNSIDKVFEMLLKTDRIIATLRS